jgi:uncharacterized RDD family membrane protein YckC
VTVTEGRVRLLAQPAVASGGARWWASGWDYLVILGWLAVLTVAGLGVRTLMPPAPASQIAAPAADVVVFALTVLPVWVYLTATEAGRSNASWGKRRTGLRVTGADGGRSSPGRVALRNAVKLLPWQLAHLAVARILLDPTATATAFVVVTYALSLVLPVVSVVMAWRDPWRRALHDRVAGTRVTTSPAGPGS